jgi:hypothetical protein
VFESQTCGGEVAADQISCGGVAASAVVLGLFHQPEQFDRGLLCSRAVGIAYSGH